VTEAAGLEHPRALPLLEDLVGAAELGEWSGRHVGFCCDCLSGGGLVGRGRIVLLAATGEEPDQEECRLELHVDSGRAGAGEVAWIR
jgi:hypothetical protein